MSRKTFFIQLGVLTAVVATLLCLLLQTPTFKGYQLVSWISLAAFVLLSIGMYAFGKSAAQHENKNLFTNVVMGFTMIKLFLTIAVVLGYNEIMQPDNKAFIIPFFGIYLIYTVYETWFMMRLGKLNKVS
ncbi:MAG TPA: hypothetical protein PKA00_02380 [Saprospiraceae bacterium]|nr:hypothetical protein [Saprospiraceae bacterium]HMQ81719.1 hypothetical protein [Saprospiraceae bacterium]